MALFLRGAGLRVLNGDPQLMRVRALRFNAFMIAQVQSGAMAIEWTRTRPHSHRRYLFMFVNRGAISFDGDSRVWTNLSGGLCLIFPGRTPVDVHIDEASEFVVFSFDQAEIDPYVLSPTNMDEAKTRSTAFRAIYAYLQAVTEQPRIKEDEKDSRILRALTQDVARTVAIAAMGDWGSDGVFQHAQRVIHEQAVDPDFDVDQLATQCGVSRRTLNRIYAKHDLHAAAEILRTRTQNAMALISENHAIGVETVAAASGFNSLSTMARAFKKAYGTSPSDLRAKQRRFGAPEGSRSDPDQEDQGTEEFSAS
ncbi:helix-turn-helix domain-containing protein [Microbacterium sp. NPDC056052]|uniref:AraC family transcriptional regulator n=1 Tax=Microbacterium sp. NPDC056052 TaxID=3345695 RepID=UPI0035DA4007